MKPLFVFASVYYAKASGAAGRIELGRSTYLIMECKKVAHFSPKACDEIKKCGRKRQRSLGLLGLHNEGQGQEKRGCIYIVESLASL